MLWPGRNLFPYELDILYIADASPSPFSNWVDTSGNSWPCFWSPQSTETSADQIPIHRTHLPIVGGGSPTGEAYAFGQGNSKQPTRLTTAIRVVRSVRSRFQPMVLDRRTQPDDHPRRSHSLYE